MFKTLTNDELKELIEWMEETDTDYSIELLYAVILLTEKSNNVILS